MFVSPLKLQVEILTPQNDGIRKWDVWEVLKSRGWSRREWGRCLRNEAAESCLAPSPGVSGLGKGPETMPAPRSLEDCQPPEL